ncbi:MAG: 16S rRNA (adenine(1518)-N(6)/adenine(1519)-N(6))-dimethyltransferase RsmA [Candidatus Eisenbacteria bacterium]
MSPGGAGGDDAGIEGGRGGEGSASERAWLRAHGVTPRKRLGQNFLVHPAAAGRLVRAMKIAEGSDVLEIGAGAGSLTRALLDPPATGSGRPARVWSVEVDARLAALLRERFAPEITAGRLHLLEGSILDLDPCALPGRAAASDGHDGEASDGDGAGASGWTPRSSPLFLAGNLPYAITTPILLWTLEHRASFSRAAFLVQREVAARLLASPGGRTYGSLTVWVSYHAAVEKLASVGPSSFWPVPEVDSTLIGLRFHPQPPVDAGDPRDLEKALAAAFGQRRKMLRAALRSALGDGALAARVLSEAGIDPTRRAETLDLAAFAALARALASAAGPSLR